MASLAQVIARRKELRKSQRRIIFNDDGAAISRYDKNFGWPITEQSWIGYWLGPHRGIGNPFVSNPTPSQVDAVCFATWYPGRSLHKSAIPNSYFGNPGFVPSGDFVDATQNLYNNTGKCALEIAGNFCSANSMELFCSFRMNDGHDSIYTRDQLNEIKKGFWDSGSLLRNGFVNMMDFSKQEITDYIYDCAVEVINSTKFKISGLELDFYRTLGFFDNAVLNEDYPAKTSQAQLDAVSSLIFRIRDAMDARSMALMDQGREPLLLMVHTPDDPAYCKGNALDVELWMRQGWVDVLVTSGLHQIRPIRETVTWGARFGVPTYSAIVDPRFASKKTRQQETGLAARALQALEAGAPGTYWFNYNYPHDPSFLGASSNIWRYIGTAPGIRSAVSRRYYVTHVNQNTAEIGSFVLYPDWGFYPHKVSVLSTEDCQSGTDIKVRLECYEPSSKAATLSLDAVNFEGAPLVVTLNGVACTWVSDNGSIRVYSVPSGALSGGDNAISVSGSGRYFRLNDLELLVS